MKIIILLNAKAGSIDGRSGHDESARLRELCAGQGLEADVRPVHGAELARAARDALRNGADAVVAAGGDGTVSAVAGALAHQPIPLGILPLGTLNHFAKDLGVPLELERAIAAIAAGHIQEVDLGEVNGRYFINNSSIGLYPQVVRDRDAQRTRLGRGKWLAMFFAMLAALRVFPMLRVRIGIEDRSVLRTTPFVFVGNNEYDVSLLNVRDRHRLNAGQLCLYVTHRTGRWGIFILALRAMFGRLQQAADFESASVEELWIETGRHSLHVALDGEVCTMAPPLHYRSHPGALKVLAPGAKSDAS